MAATLHDFDDPVGDRTLVLRLLRGLSGKFRSMVTNIKLQQPFPTFVEARTLLLLEEIDLNDVAAETDATPPPAPTALVTGSSSTVARPPPGRAPSGSAPVHNGQGGGSGGNQGNRYRWHRGRGGNKQQQHNNSIVGAPHPPLMLYNSWAGTVQFWSHPPSSGSAPGVPYRPPPAGFMAVPQSPQPYLVPYGYAVPPGFGYG
ncbi:uncharacterized protein [Miscanthus floridulus]|uniref:uncharacterized protein n=1 Tax=Miscanthus floridulus TaxID=154761 RepID=UPI00345AB3FF